MKFIFAGIVFIILIGGGFFFFSKNGENGIGTPSVPEETGSSDAIEGWPDGVPVSPALKEAARDLKPKFDTSEWEAYANEKIGIAFQYPSTIDNLVLNLKPRVMEENSVGPWYNMNEVEWLATIHLVEEIRADAEGFFVISVFKKDGKFEDVVQKVREFTVSGKTFLSERAVKLEGALEGVRIATVNKEETSYAIAYILHTPSAPKNFIIDIVIDRIYDPAETEDQFTERVSREQQYFDAVVSTFQAL